MRSLKRKGDPTVGKTKKELMEQYEMYKHRLPLQIKDFAIENLGSSVDENEACECIDSGNNEPSDDTMEIDCSI